MSLYFETRRVTEQMLRTFVFFLLVFLYKITFDPNLEKHLFEWNTVLSSINIYKLFSVDFQIRAVTEKILGISFSTFFCSFLKYRYIFLKNWIHLVLKRKTSIRNSVMNDWHSTLNRYILFTYFLFEQKDRKITV